MQWKSSSSGTRILLGSQSRNQTQVPPDPAMDQLCDSEQGLTLSGPPWPHRDCLLRILSTQSKHMWPPHTEGSAGLRCCRGSSPGGRDWGPGASVIGQSREGSGTLPTTQSTPGIVSPSGVRRRGLSLAQGGGLTCL